MTAILSHQWLELTPEGTEARDGKVLRGHERDMLVVLGARPCRLVDLFRRLQMRDLGQFNELLQRAVLRHWVRVHDEEPSVAGDPADSVLPVVPASGNALADLMARYTQQTPPAPARASGPDSGSAGLADTAPGPVVELASVEEAEADLTLLESPSPEDALALLSEGARLPETGAEESDQALEAEGPAPWELIPEAGPGTEEDTQALLRAMGIIGRDPSARVPIQAPPAPAPSVPAWRGQGGESALLEALSRGGTLSSSEPSSVVIPVPAYGLPPQASPAPAGAEDGFIRLRDQEPYQASPTTPAPPMPAPRPEPAGPLSERSQHRLAAREQLLSSARREAAERQANKDRQQKMEAERAAAQAEREARLEAQRKAEQASQAGTLRARAEKARALRERLEKGQDKQ